VCGAREMALDAFWSSCGLPADAWPAAKDAYERYERLIDVHNAAARLMGPGTEGDFSLKHVADCLAVLRAWPDLFAGDMELADVGCGAGLPGIVLAVALPQVRLTAIESNRRKADFVRDAADALGLGDRVQVVARRSRELGYQDAYRGRFPVVTARAVGRAEKVIRDTRLLIAPGGSAILYKTPAAIAEEWPLAAREAGKHKLALDLSDVVALPTDAGTRQLVRVRAP